MALKASVEELKQKSGGDGTIKASGFNYVSWQQQWQTVTCIASLFLACFLFFCSGFIPLPSPLLLKRYYTPPQLQPSALPLPSRGTMNFLKDMKLGLDLDQRTIW